VSQREERVLRMRFGIGMNTDHTLEEVGQQFSVTRERIRQAFAGEGAAEAEASEPVKEDALFPRPMRTPAGLPILLAALLAACGDGAFAGGNGQTGDALADGGSRARIAADRFREDCVGAETQTPDKAMRAHLRRLCACSHARIAATPMSMTESGDSVSAKVDAVARACLSELGGAPGEGRQPEANETAPGG